MEKTWAWGPLGWLIESEIFPLETQNTGYFFASSILQYAMPPEVRIFFFFTVWLITICSFTMFMLPQTKGILINETYEGEQKKHWLWKKYYDHDPVKDIKAPAKQSSE